MDDLKIAIAGVGTVGNGVLILLKKNRKKIEKKIGRKIKITAIASRKSRDFKGLKKTKIFSDANSFLNFSDYDLLLELIGGSDGVAKEIIIDALKKKKHVITANKALLSKHGNYILKLADSQNVLVGYEASVAGGIPIITVINNFLVSNTIKKISGILNGTSNYILSKMLETKKDFKTILNDAKAYGYAEADPSFDINGMDTAHKLSIMSSISFNNKIDFDKVFVSGIENIQYTDLKYADELGFKIKLLGITKIVKSKVMQFVYPALVNKESLLGKVDNVFNGIMIETDSSKKFFFQGEGAGALPTATSVLSDLERISLTNYSKKNYKNTEILAIKDYFKIDERYGSYYFRIKTFDVAGVIADISKILKKYNISIKSLYQKENAEKNYNEVDIVITTHNCEEKNVCKATNQINKLNSTKERVVIYRVEIT